MVQVLRDIVTTPILWLLVFVPVVLVGEHIWPDAHTLLFVLSVLAIIPLAALLSQATESVAHRTGDAIGGLLNASLGNLTELVIALTALQAGQYLLVKASIAGAIVTSSLFMLGGSFLLGGLRHHTQQFNESAARLQAIMLFLATVALLVPSAVERAEITASGPIIQDLSLGLAILLIGTYGLGLLYSLGTHKGQFQGEIEHHAEEPGWPLGVSIVMLVIVTVLVALVSEVFVASVQEAAETFGMTPAFVGFVVVALVGAAAEMLTAFTAARKDRLDLSVSIALGSSSQIALFVAPVMVIASYFIGPQPMSLEFWPGAVVMVFFATLTAIITTNGGRSTWFLGAALLIVYVIFAMTLFLLPPAG
jgi:Ca2+:H+ antiporter